MSEHPSSTGTTNPAQRLVRSISVSIREYVQITIGGDTAGLGLLKEYALAGPQYWLGLAALVFGIVASAWLTLGRRVLPSVSAEVYEGQWLTLPSAGLWAALAVLAFGWAYLLQGAARYGLGAYVFATVYVLYFGMSPAMLHHRATWFALAPAWLAVQGAWLAVSEPRSLWRWLWLLLLGLVVGLYTYNGLGLSRLFPTAEMTGRLALGLVWCGLLALASCRRAPRFRPGIAWAITLGVFLALYLLASALSPAQELLRLTFVSLHDLLGLVGLFWFWMGLDLFSAAQDLVTWTTTATQRLLSQRVLRALIVLFWVLRLLVDYLAVRTPPLWLLNALLVIPGSVKLLRWLWALPWAPATLDALYYDLYAMLAVAVLALGLWVRRKLTHARLVALFGYSLLALLALLGGQALFYAVATPQDEAPSSLWPLILYVSGMVWQVIKSGAGLAEGRARKPLFMGFLLALVGIATLELGGGYGLFQLELAMNTYFGALYLGLPYLLYRYVFKRQRRPPLPARALWALFGIGMLTAMPAVWFEAWYLAPLLWCLGLLASVWRAGRWETPGDGLVYALTLSLGYVTYFTQPVLIPVPAFVEQLGAIMYAQAAYVEHAIYPWEPLWWLVLVVYAAAASLLGLAAERAHRASGARPWAWLALGCLGSVILVSALHVLAA